MENSAGGSLDLIDAGVAASRMLGSHVSGIWSAGDRHHAAVHGDLESALIAAPPDWGLSLFLGTSAWLWVSAAAFESAEIFGGPDGDVLSISAGALSVIVERSADREVK